VADRNELGPAYWRGRIEALFRGEIPTDLPHGRDDEPHHHVERMGKPLSGGVRDVFLEAISELLQTTPPLQQNAERLYRLLYLVSVFTPPSAEAVVWRLLRDETLVDLKYEPYHLHSLALSLLADYRPDEDAWEYVQATCPKAEDFRVLLAGFRLMGRTKRTDVAFRFLRHLIPRLTEDERYADQVSYLLLGMMGPMTYAGLLRFLQWSDTVLQPKLQQEYELFCSSLRSVLLGWTQITPGEKDEYVWLCSGWLNAGYYCFTAEEIFEFALRGSAAHLEPQTTEVLKRIHDRNVAAGLHMPWSFSDDRHLRKISCLHVSRADSGRHNFDQEQFREEANIIARAMPLRRPSRAHEPELAASAAAAASGTHDILNQNLWRFKYD
jgi:hypothetical protein